MSLSVLEQLSQSEGLETSPTLVLTVDHSQEEMVEQLRAEVEKKTQMLMEVKRHLREAAEREREREKGQALVAEERDALRERVQMVRNFTTWNDYCSLSLSLSYVKS